MELCLARHGNYPTNEHNQTMYPRYRFFKACTDCFKAVGASAPIFSDKHLSWRFDWAQEMVALSKELDFPFMAGSSLPIAWRMPSVDMPYGAEVEEVMCCAYGGVDSYDFHALEVIQCMAERRAGGETGVEWVEAFQGADVWKLMRGVYTRQKTGSRHAILPPLSLSVSFSFSLSPSLLLTPLRLLLLVE